MYGLIWALMNLFRQHLMKLGGQCGIGFLSKRLLHEWSLTTLRYSPHNSAKLSCPDVLSSCPNASRMCFCTLLWNVWFMEMYMTSRSRFQTRPAAARTIVCNSDKFHLNTAVRYQYAMKTEVSNMRIRWMNSYLISYDGYTVDSPPSSRHCKPYSRYTIILWSGEWHY
jgi:hypothetical protein